MKRPAAKFEYLSSSECNFTYSQANGRASPRNDEKELTTGGPLFAPLVLCRAYHPHKAVFHIHENIIKKQQRERKITSVVDTASMDGFMERFTLRNIVFACF